MTYNPQVALEAIHAVMDGTEWSPDTCEAVAEILTSIGFEIRAPEENEEEQ